MFLVWCTEIIGKNNNYGHPSKEVIYLLEKYKKVYYKTSSNNSIYLINIFGKVRVFTQKQINYFYGIY